MGGRSRSKNSGGGGNRGGGGGGGAPDNSAQIAEMNRQQAAQAQNFARMQAEAAAAAEAKRKAEEQAARDKAIAEESARARGMAISNQNEVGEKLKTTLSQSTSQVPSQANVPYSASGANFAKPTKAVPGAPSAPSETAAAMPQGMIAQKINQDSGGTNQQQNRFTIPKTEGLVFGGT